MAVTDRSSVPVAPRGPGDAPAKGMLSRLRGDNFLRNSGKFLTGTLARTLAQGVLFVLLAREMPIDEYGIFVGITALVALVSPFASVGATSLIMQNYADEPSGWHRHLSRALLLSVVSGCLGTVVVAAAGVVIWGDRVGLLDLLCLALADLVAWRLIEVVAASVQVRGRVFIASSIPAVLHVARLVAAVALAMASAGALTLTAWAVTSAFVSGVICLLTIMYGVRGAGRLRVELRSSFGQVRTGMLFAVGLSAQTVYNDLDKVMLSRLNSPESAAIYAAAYRVLDFAHVPVRSMAAVAYPRFFAAGRAGASSAVKLTRTLVPKYLAYSIVAAAGLAGFAWLMPYIFGADFAAAETALQGLSAILVLKAIHYLAADTLSGSRRQGLRTICQLAVALTNFLLNLWLIPAYGWQGAVASSLICDGLLCVLLWGCLLYVLRREAHARPSVAEGYVVLGEKA